MGIDELMGDYWPVLVMAGSVLFFYLSFKNGENTANQGIANQRPLSQQEDEDESYRKMSFSEAKETEEDSSIEGIITEFYIFSDGYSGIIGEIPDGKARMPFYFGNDSIDTEEDAGIVPILLNDSLKKENKITMEGHYDGDAKMFIVESLEYVLDGEAYSV